MTIYRISDIDFFLGQMSWRFIESNCVAQLIKRVKWAFDIRWRPSSIHFHVLNFFWKHGAESNHIWLKIISDSSVLHQRWPLWLKIEIS